jgi:hypothetical protein
MTIVELANALKCSTKGAADVPDRLLVALISGVYQQINEAIDRMDEGVLNIQGLGQFRMRQVVRDKDGDSAKRKLVVYRRAAAKKGC